MGFVAFGSSEGRVGEGIVAKIHNNARPIFPGWICPVAFPHTKRPIANVQQLCHFRLPEPRIKAFLAQMLSQRFRLLGDGKAAGPDRCVSSKISELELNHSQCRMAPGNQSPADSSVS